MNNTLFVDVGGTHTRIWSDRFRKKYRTDLASLPSVLKKFKSSDLIIGLRGVWTATEKKIWRTKLRGTAQKITVLSDIELAHYLAFGEGAGIVLNAGTGSIAFGRNQNGKTARAGGLGPLIGDEGSAFWIGREILKLDYMRYENPDHVRPFVVGENAVAKVAALAKKALRSARRKPGSMESRIIDEAQLHLKDLVNEVRSKLKMGPETMVLVIGGLFEDRFFSDRWRKFRSRP